MLGQRSGQGQHVARVGGLECDPAQQAFEVEDAIERAAQLLARDGFLYLRLDRIQPRVDFGDDRSTAAASRRAAGACPWA